MTRDATTAFARALVDEWVAAGLAHAVVAPGSRSTPVALALADDGRVLVHVVLDERAAGFVALGLGRATGRPAVVLTTSGTAAVHLHAAVVEADLARVPLLAVTADRPAELRGRGAPQTIDQVDLYGHAVRWSADVTPPVDEPAAAAGWRDLAAASVEACVGTPPGPAHLNLQLREPLVPTGAPLVPVPPRASRPSRAAPARVRPSDVRAVAGAVRAAPRGVLVLGDGASVPGALVDRFAAASGWIVLADPTALAADRGLGAVEALLRVPGVAADLRPDRWLRVGAVPASRVVAEWLDGSPGVLVDDGAGRWRDPGGSADLLVAGAPPAVLDAVAGVLGPPADDGWAAGWRALDRAAVAARDATLDRWPECSEPRAARDVLAALPAGARVVLGSSMPIRDVAWFGHARADVRVLANRGANGIDGIVSTGVGVALAGPGSPTVVLTGDLGFLHDGGGMLAASRLEVDLVVVVVDNAGGGIFSFLPQAGATDHFEELFGTPPRADVAALARAQGFAVADVTGPDAVGPAVAAAVAAGGRHVVRVGTERARNVAHHREAWDAVAAAVSDRTRPGPA